MEQKKVRSYFLYAFGEIALVVLGILIALQINSWNDERINGKKETRYLQSLIRDLETQIIQIDLKVERELLGKKAMEELMDEFRLNGNIIFSDENVVKFNNLADRATYVVNKPTFTELLSTGNLEVISNDNLRNQIVDYYQKMELSELIILKNNDQKDNTILPSVLKLVEFSPSALILTNNPNYLSEDSTNWNSFQFPSMREIAEEINSDKTIFFELINLLKMRWLISVASINLLKEDRNRAQGLINEIENNF